MTGRGDGVGQSARYVVAPCRSYLLGQHVRAYPLVVGAADTAIHLAGVGAVPRAGLGKVQERFGTVGKPGWERGEEGRGGGITEAETESRYSEEVRLQATM